MTVDRALLPRTFGRWFGRFHSLTEVQEKSIPLVMSGKDVLICSATASGKTEAYAAPCAEVAALHGKDLPVAVIVAPTRALTNDLKRRLEGPMHLVEVSFGRYTGEHKERVAGKLPHIVVTTPEALDSLLARRAHLLADVRMVVLDEIHVLDNTPRGDQLRMLLHRLEGASARTPQRIAVSATVDRPGEMAARYLRDFEMVVVHGIRKIRGTAFEGDSATAVGAHLDELGRHGFKKILVFCRSRNQVETYASKLVKATRFSEAVYAHHGSLAKVIRERNERLFHAAPAAVCFATLTLEMGIDIGTVDYILLAGLPGDVSSLLQRIGRGGRRGDSTRAGYVVRNAADRHVFETMFRLGKRGRLCGLPYGFRPSVVIQQALVLACAETYIERADLERALPPDVRAELGENACPELLESAVEAGLLEQPGRGRFVPSAEIEQRYEIGTLHSNIADEPSIRIVDRLTGDVLGSIQSADTRNIEIGGRDRKIAKFLDGRLLTDAGKEARPARFRTTGSPTVSLLLGRAVVEALGVPAGAVGIVQQSSSTILLHGLGTVGVLLLAHLYSQSVGRDAVGPSSPYTLEVSGRVDGIPTVDEDSASRFVDKHLSALAKLSSPGPWDHAVPESLRKNSTRRITGIDEVLAFFAGARVTLVADPSSELMSILEDL